MNAIVDGLTYLTCPNHKTSNTYGELGKHLTPGTHEATSCNNCFGEMPFPMSTRIGVTVER